MNNELRDGEYITCCACQKPALVKLFAKAQISLIGPDAIQSLKKQNVAMRCQDCGVLGPVPKFGDQKFAR